MQSCIALCALVLLAIGAPTLAQQRPSFCSADCPLFTSTTGNCFEIRTLSQRTWWAGTSTTIGVQDTMGWVQTSRMFAKLFTYVGGYNVGNRQIDMNVPVVTKVELLPGGTQARVTMMVYLYGGNVEPPTPYDRAVSISSMPAGTRFYVRTFHSYLWASTSDYASNLQSLMDDLGSSYSYSSTVSYYAGYESPFHIGQRRYEAWLEA